MVKVCIFEAGRMCLADEESLVVCIFFIIPLLQYLQSISY